MFAAILKALAPLAQLANKIFDSFRSSKRKKRHEKVIENIQSGNLDSARKVLNKQLRDKASRRKQLMRTFALIIIITLNLAMSSCGKKPLENPDVPESTASEWLLYENGECFSTKDDEKTLVDCYSRAILITQDELTRILDEFNAICP